MALSQGREITEESISETIRASGNGTPKSNFVQGASLKETVEEVEKRLILNTLQIYRYHQRQTALALGLSRQGLSKKMKRYGISDG